MNISEFQDYFKIYKGVTALPRHPMKHVWREQTETITRLYNGEQSADFLRAFPRENPDDHKFRLCLWEPVAKPLLLKATDDLQRVFASSKYSINFANEQMTEICQSDKTAKTIINMLPTRITDPNGQNVWWPDESRINTPIAGELINFELLYISSERIINITDDFIVWFAEGVDCNDYMNSNAFSLVDGVLFNKTLSDGSRARTIAHVATDETFISIDLIESTGAKKEQSLSVYEVYKHNFSGVPAFVNGGRERKVICKKTHKPFTVYESDFCAAIPHLKRMEWRDSQRVSVDLSSGFPHKFVDGAECNTCHGSGRIHPHEKHPEYDATNPDKDVGCDTCSGSGQVLAMSPLHGYFTRAVAQGATDQERAALIKRQPITYDGPAVDLCEYQHKNYERTEAAAEKALNIYTQTNFAQSAASKDADKDGGFTQAERIAGAVFDNIQKALQVKQGLMLGDNESPVSVIRRISVKVDNDAELLSTFKATVENCPIGLRYNAYMALVKQMYSADELIVRREHLAAKYTALYLATDQEILTFKAANLPGVKRECTKALYVFTLLCQVENIMQKDDAAIFAELDAAITAIEAEADAQAANAITPDDGAIQ